LSLGSNLGDRLDNLRRGRDAVLSSGGVTLLAQSGVYETEPVDVKPEYRDRAFLNAVIVVRCGLPVEALAERIRVIEESLGRVRSADRNAPRPVDVDILYAGALRISDGRLTVPHRRWAERRFVVQPLADVRPDLVIAGQVRSVRDVLLALPARPDVVLFRREW
jgi:2-amino-4-hydroxy-6-hydroxymethyldihydropteridine diphosphokinase